MPRATPSTSTSRSGEPCEVFRRQQPEPETDCHARCAAPAAPVPVRERLRRCRGRHRPGCFDALADRSRPRDRRPGGSSTPMPMPSSRRCKAWLKLVSLAGSRCPKLTAACTSLGPPARALTCWFWMPNAPSTRTWWPHQVRVLRPGGILVADNATPHPDELAPLAAELDRSGELAMTTLEIGKGELVAVRRR